MRSFWKFLLWFLLIIAGKFSPTPVQSSSSSVPAKLSDGSNSIGRGLKHFKDPDLKFPFPDILDAIQGKFVVSHPNGTLYLFERNSPKSLWSFESGSPSSSLNQAIPGNDKQMSLYPLDGGLVPFQYDNSLIDVGDGHMQIEDYKLHGDLLFNNKEAHSQNPKLDSHCSKLTQQGSQHSKVEALLM